ncbi:MAG: penicillin-binding protein 2 [Dongiaceae bacterium]
MQQNQQAHLRLFTRRTALLGGLKLALLGTLAGRMYYLQVVDADKYATLAEENRISVRLLAPLRGRITDRFGYTLATNDQNYRVVIIPEQTDDLEQTLRMLSLILPLSESDIARVLRDAEKKRAFVPITVRENLVWEDVARVEINTPDLPGITIEVEQRRNYPYGGLAAHVLGYVAAVAEADLTDDPLLELPGFRIGKTGVERQYDVSLRGSAGTSHVEVNAIGRVIRELQRKEGEPGQDIALTIDMGLQHFAQQRLAGELSAMAVVLDVVNGEVMAMASTPAFDPTLFDRGLTTAEWQQLVNDPLHPLTNKTISGQYAPGSTFKMMVTLAALASGIGPSHTVYCPGHMSLGTSRFHCWKKGGHGTLDMLRGLQHSCDVYFYDIARRAGIDAIAEMSRRFGLGVPTGIDLPGEKPGVVPDRNWKLGATGEPWQPGETLVAGIGQGFILTTPLQLALMAARIGNGGMGIVPHIRREAVFRPGDQPGAAPAGATSIGVAPEHMLIVQEGMNLVSNDPRGTAYRSRIEQPGMELAGKTGTAQVRRITAAERASGVIANEDLPWERRDHALFVAYAPVASPRYACSVIVQHGGGGSRFAAPIARDILIETQLRDPASRVPAPRIAAVGPR